MALFDLMGSVFKGLFDPTALARDMAQMNISPDELMAQMQKTQQLQTMPTMQGQQQAQQQKQQQSNPFSFPQMLQDLFAPTPPTAQAGQAGQAISQSLGQVGPDMNNIMSKIGRDRKSTRLNSSHGYISYAVFCLKKKRPVHCAHPVS